MTKDLINLIKNRKLLADIKGFECTPEYLYEHLGSFGYSLEQITEEMKNV